MLRSFLLLDLLLCLTWNAFSVRFENLASGKLKYMRPVADSCPPPLLDHCGRDGVCLGNKVWMTIALLWRRDVLPDCLEQHHVRWIPPPAARPKLLSYAGNVSVPFPPSEKEESEWGVDSSVAKTGGASDVDFFRSRNGKLWLKQVSDSDLAQWDHLRDAYVKRLMSTSADAPTLLVRVVGFVIINGVAWMAMLDAAAPSNGCVPESPLTCDIKPHQMSATGAGGHSYKHLQECNKFIQSRGGATRPQIAKGLLQVVKSDLAILRKGNSIDYSWIIIRACDRDPGAYNFQGKWWHVALIDFLMAYEATRVIENTARSFWAPEPLPKVYAKWNSVAGYRQGKYDMYAYKQECVFAGLVNKKPFNQFGRLTEHLKEVALKCDSFSDAMFSPSFLSNERYKAIRAEMAKWECFALKCDSLFDDMLSPSLTKERFEAIRAEMRKWDCFNFLKDEKQLILQTLDADADTSFF